MIAFATICAVVAILFTILLRRLYGQKVKFQKQYSDDNGRPTGIMEEILAHIHDTAGSLILANTLVLRSKQPITGSMVRKAMELLMKRHPMLRMCIKKNQNGEHCLQKMANLYVDLRERDTTDWKSVMEESLLDKFDGENGPLWRVTLLPNARYEPDIDEDIPHITSYPHQCICIFGFHHITVDGPSYSRMFAEFMRYLGNIINNEEPEVSSMPMLPPVDLYIDEVIQPKWYHPVMQLLLEKLSIIPGFSAFMMERMFGEGNAFTRKHGVEIHRYPHIQPKTKIIPVEFTKVETSSLLKKCKEHQSTVQGAVQTAAGVSMVTMLEEQKLEVATRVTVNVRPYLKTKVPNDYAGPYFLGLEFENPVVSSPDPGLFWNMAKQASSDIHTRLNNSEHMKGWPAMKCLFPVMIGMIGKIAKVEDDKNGKRIQQLIVFTNLGYAKFLDGSPEDDVILRARFGCSAEHQQGCIFGNNMVTFNGKLFWTVAYYSNIVSDAVLPEVCQFGQRNYTKSNQERQRVNTTLRLGGIFEHLSFFFNIKRF